MKVHERLARVGVLAPGCPFGRSVHPVRDDLRTRGSLPRSLRIKTCKALNNESQVERLLEENANLKKRVAELEAFLKEDSESSPASQDSQEKGAEKKTIEEAEVDFATIALPRAGESFWETIPVRTQSSGDVADVAMHERDASPMSVAHLTAEMAPLAKVGGLGDVVTGLARSCTARGHNVEIILPFYQCINEDLLQDLKFEFEYDCPKGREWDGQFQVSSLKTLVYTATCEGIKVVLLRPNWEECNFFQGGQVYAGSYNETEAYLYFCRAGLEFLKVSGRQPDIIHLHEWQTSAAAMLYWEIYNKEGLHKPRVVLTIHNMDNTGECRAEEFGVTGVSGDLFNTVEKALDERTIGHNPERLSLLKGGVVYSNVVTTVSPTYAEETSTGQGGWLSGTLSMYSSKYHGILNGIDNVMWDPQRDLYLPCPFSPGNLQGKRFLQKYVRRGLGFEDPAEGNRDESRKPLVICITRLVPQKGIHLIRHAIFRTVEKGGQFILLGSGHADGDFRHLAENEFRDHPDVKLMVTYSEALSHFLFAAADVVLVPSIFEPCGLTQMIGMRYGAVPVVRQTGGLADTVKDVDDDNIASERKNGFTFTTPSEESLNGALDRAIKYHRERATWWDGLTAKIMTMDFSWQKSASSYLDLYKFIE
jgi:starch synthase